eukprot:m.274310 g.274310  ORF g.274310 m.274310 type:complete len:118 (-) comp17685_c0_seq5:2899-3252(-)
MQCTYPPQRGVRCQCDKLQQQQLQRQGLTVSRTPWMPRLIPKPSGQTVERKKGVMHFDTGCTQKVLTWFNEAVTNNKDHALGLSGRAWQCVVGLGSIAAAAEVKESRTSSFNSQLAA